MRKPRLTGNRDVALRALAALSVWALVSAAAAALILSRTPAVPGEKRSARLRRAIRGRGGFAAAASGLILAALLLLFLWSAYHPFGTDKTGNDVLYQAVKSLRTAFVLGSLSTITMLPFAVFFGIAAGFFRGWVDDVVQYLYTTISSIPSVLLIAATALMIQVFIDQHPLLLPTSLERGDAKLFFIAAIIGVTGWASLARLLRAETMKLSGLDFITAARACGTPSGVIMRRAHSPECASHHPHCVGDRVLGHCALRSGAFLYRGRRRSFDEFLWLDDQRGTERNVPDTDRLVESFRGLHLHGRRGAERESLRLCGPRRL